MDDSLIFSHLRAVCEQRGLRWCEYYQRDGRAQVLVMRAEDAEVAIGDDLPVALKRLGAVLTPAQLRERKIAEARAELQRLENLPTSL